MDQPPSKPSFADDPNFLASLSDLDSGLLEGEEKGRASPRKAPAPPARRPPAETNTSDLAIDLAGYEFPPAGTPERIEPLRVAPQPASLPRKPVATRPAAAQPRAPAVVLPEIVPPPPGGRRPLLDLFPPPPGGTSEPPDLAIGIAPPPSIAARAPVSPIAAVAAVPAPPVTYEPFYGLAEKPFTLSTDPKFVYHSTAHDFAAQDLLSAIRRRDRLVVLTGEVGVGKTTLCRAVSEELDRRTLTSIVLDPYVSVETLLQTVLVDFGVISRDDVARGLLAQASGAELFAKLREFLASLVQLEAFAVVIIDEAQNLPAPVLEQIRTLMDLDAEQQLLQIALVGQPALLKLLARGELRELQQRVSVRSELKGLAADEMASYVRHRLSVAGQARIEFDDLAFAQLYRVSGGVPRVVNLVCDRALTLGYNASASVIDDTLILTAAHDLDVAPPEPRARRLLRMAMTTAALIVLMAAGAAAAAWVYRAPLSRIIAQWTHVPPPPRAPRERLPPTLTPASPPSDQLTAPSSAPRR